jgi:DNA-binding response OmpR family regulator
MRSLGPRRAGALQSDVQEPRGSNTISCTVHARLQTTIIAGRRLIDALEAGANDFVLTSVHGTLSIRVRLAIKGVHSEEQHVGASNVSVDWSRSTVTSGRSTITLSNTELRLLAALLEGNDAPVARLALISRIWPADSLPIHDRENALAVYVCSLRKRLTGIGLGSALQTVRGVGYRLSL